MNNSLIVMRSHAIIRECKFKNVAIDATVGNGHDTLFLAPLFKQVYSFDIQPLAIKRTKEKIRDYSNITLINDDFNNIKSYVTTKADLIIFNLGFLPGSNKKVLTSNYHSEEAIINAYSLLNEEGVMLICCYLVHDGGKEEFYRIISTLKNNSVYFNSESFNDGKEILLIIKKQLVS